MKEVVIAVIGGGALGTLITGIFRLIEKSMEKKEVSLKDVKDSVDAIGDDLNAFKEETKKDIDVMKSSQMETSRERIKTICREKIHKGSISSDELEDLIALHKSYKALGGNGFCDNLMSKVNKLPIK